MLSSSSKFDPRIIKLHTKIISPSGKEETAYAVIGDIPHLPDNLLARVVSETYLKTFLEFVMEKETLKERYNAFSWPRNAEGSMRFTLQEPNKWNTWGYLYIHKMENDSNYYRHVGTALHEFALRYSLIAGKEGRVREDAAWSSHVFHRKCGYSPGTYSDSREQRINKENEMDDKIEKLRQAQGDCKSIDTSSLGSVDMYLCEEQIAQKKRQFGIVSDELAITSDNFIAASTYLGLSVPEEIKPASETLTTSAPEETKEIVPENTPEPIDNTPILLKSLPATLLEVNHSVTTKHEQKENNQRLAFIIGNYDDAFRFWRVMQQEIGEENVDFHYDQPHEKSYITVKQGQEAVLTKLGIGSQSTKFENPRLQQIQHYAQQRLQKKEYYHYCHWFQDSKSVKLAAALLSLAYPDQDPKKISKNRHIQHALTHHTLGKKINT